MLNFPWSHKRRDSALEGRVDGLKFSLILFDGEILFLFKPRCPCAYTLNENIFDNCLQELVVEMQRAV